MFPPTCWGRLLGTPYSLAQRCAISGWTANMNRCCAFERNGNSGLARVVRLQKHARRLGVVDADRLLHDPQRLERRVCQYAVIHRAADGALSRQPRAARDLGDVRIVDLAAVLARHEHVVRVRRHQASSSTGAITPEPCMNAGSSGAGRSVFCCGIGGTVTGSTSAGSGGYASSASSGHSCMPLDMSRWLSSATANSAGSSTSTGPKMLPWTGLTVTAPS